MSTRDHSPKRSYRTRLTQRTEPVPEVEIVGPRTKAELHALISNVFHVKDAATFYEIKDGEFITQNDDYGMTLNQCVDWIVHKIWSERKARLLEFPEDTIALAASLLYVRDAAGDGLFLSVFNALEIWDYFGDWASSVAMALISCDHDIASEMPVRRALLRLASRFSEKLPRAKLLQEFADFDWDTELRRHPTVKSGIKAAYEQTRVIESLYSPPWAFGGYDDGIRQAVHELAMDINCANDVLLPAVITGLRNPVQNFWSLFVQGARAVHAKTPFCLADAAGVVVAYNNLPYRDCNLNAEFAELFMLDMASQESSWTSHLCRRLSHQSVTEPRFFTSLACAE